MRITGITDEAEKIEALQDYIAPHLEVQKWYKMFEKLKKEVRELDMEEMQREKEELDEHKKDDEERERRIIQQQKASIMDITSHLQSLTI
ncbi:hypothetical protein M404DRAFT_29156 [Pisolithus tinctorius Marx 270]|uniref:Uncharacterized protein n=1 Tax=Pisolithus tinctorius Marx 270 TaxID=870435 RepID=A0A0C3P0T4_PISTI|nr:hypothetical protein M404DRAFT_29156 [Pisolithus tinctorius Marx 270]